MSGDAQPRKRKDKRRKKVFPTLPGQVEARRAEEYAEEREILHQLSTNSEPEEEELYTNLKETDEVIHVHKDANTGGNIVTKIIFFLFMAALATMIGFILLEHRGTTDEDHNVAGRGADWSHQLKDWSNLIAIPNLVPDLLKGETNGKDHDDDRSREEADNQADEIHDDDAPSESDGSSWLSFNLGSWGGGSDESAPDGKEPVEEVEATSSWFSLNYFGGGEEQGEELADDKHEETAEEEDQASEEVDGAQLSEEEEDEPVSDEVEQSDEKTDYDNEEEENVAEEEVDEEDPSGELLDEDFEPESRGVLEEEDEEEEEKEDEDDEDEKLNLSASEENTMLSEEVEDNSAEEDEEDDPRGSVFPFKSSTIEEDEDESTEEEQQVEQTKLENASEEELFPEAIEALQQEASELLREQKEQEEVTDESAEVPDIVEEDEEEPATAVDEVTEGTEGNEAQEGQETDFSREENGSPPSHIPPPSSEPSNLEPTSYWAEEIKTVETAVPPSTPSPELEEEYEEESDAEEEEEEDDLSEDAPPINPKIYEELIAKYGNPTPESSEPEGSDDGNREYSDGGEEEGSVGEEESGDELEESEPEEQEPSWTNVKKPAAPESESGDEEEEEESDDEPPLLRTPQGGARSYEPTAEEHEDALLRKQLEQADEEFNFERYETALKAYREVVGLRPENPRARYGAARALDRIAEAKKSNVLLQEAIDEYLRLLALNDVSDDIFVSAAQRAINRLRFRGLYMKAVSVHKQLIDRFNDTVEYHTDLAINYLMVNRLSDAEHLLTDTLQRWPADPVARSHYGLVLKLGGRTKESVQHLQRGLESDHPTTRDSRLYFHLGDALSREGRSEEAMQVYKSGVEKGLFRSEYQRSLYNVDHLAARPWWTLAQTTHKDFFKMLESNWKVIRDEGRSAMKLKGLYQDEAENLRDVGDWKQFPLFARGKKYAENCAKTPVTCKIIGDFAPARGCKRGQSKFSVMEGGTHVWPHCGPTNCRLRAHLGLIVPPGPAIRVADDTRKWAEGKVMVFDDSFEHEVWHNGTALRLVLIVDIWHPELSPAERASLSPI